MATSEGRCPNNRIFERSATFRQISQMLNSKDSPSSSTVVHIDRATEMTGARVDLLRVEGASKLVILGLSLESLSKSGQFFVCCSGVFMFYLIYGYVQVSSHTFAL